MKRIVRYAERDGSYKDVEEEIPAEEAAEIMAALQESEQQAGSEAAGEEEPT